jgi:heme exporter protein C
MWGTWWIWDARLTSELVLLLLYMAVLAVLYAYQHKANGDRMGAILVLVGFMDLPIIHYSVYWWNTLHQGATLTVFERPKMDTSMLYPLLILIAGFGAYAAYAVLLKTRHLLLARERRQPWVRALIAGDAP